MKHNCKPVTFGDHAEEVCTTCKASLSLPSYNELVDAIQRVRELAEGFGTYDEFAEQFYSFTGTQIKDEILKALDGGQ